MAVEDVHKYFKARQKAYSSNNLVEVASLCNNIGVYYTEKGEHEKALQYHREELQLTSSLKDKLGEAIAHRKIGECLADMCRFGDALREQELYLKLAKSLHNLQEIQRAHATMGRMWYMMYKSNESGDRGLLEKARSSFTAALKVCEELERSGDTVTRKELSDMRARIYLNLGLLAEETKDLEGAEQHYQRACIIGKEYCINDSLLWQCYFNHGELLLELRQGNKALVIFEESLKYASRNNQNKSLSLLQMAMIYIDMVSWTPAKKYLKACLKLNCLPDDEQQRSTILKYRAVCDVMKLVADVSNCSNHEEKLALLEQLGDICCHKGVSFFNGAVQYYKAELELAEAHGVDLKRLSAILYSIAETYNDKGEYDKALEYYQKELAIWEGHSAESASSWCNIARVYDVTGKEWPVVMETYDKAISLVEQSGDQKAMRDVYKAALSYLEDVPSSVAIAKDKQRLIEEQLKLIYETDPGLVVDSQDPDSQDQGDDPTVDEQLILSCSSSNDNQPLGSEDEEGGVAQSRQLRGVALRRKSQLNKRNEKGETSLHVATIEGNARKVKQLIEEGSDVRTRDYCGWTPLHEACNHGYTEIVQLLAENGADINDPGGVHCHQTTPLMDAAINGHVEITKYLIQKGAELNRKNDSGETVLEIIIQSLAGNEGGRKNYPLMKEHKEIKDLLTKHSSSHVTPPIAIVHPLQSSQSALPALIAEEDPDDDEWAESDSDPLPLRDEWLINDMEPMKKRRKTISDTNPSSHRSNDSSTSSLKRSNTSSTPSSSRRSNYSSTPSLKRSNTSSTPSSSRRSNDSSTPSLKRFTNSSTPLSRSSNTGSTPSLRRSNSSLRQSNSSSSGLTTNIEDDPANYANYDEYNMEGDCIDLDSHSDSTPIVNSNPTPPINPNPTHIANYGNTIRLKVRVEGATYLVPCERYHDNDSPTTIAYLIEEVCNRYLLQNGRRPVLDLTNSEDAFLCPTDKIIDVVRDNEVLVGVVNRWESPALNNYYKSVCEKFKTNPNNRVLGIFESNFNPLSLNLSNCGLRPTDAPALFQSLLPQSSITSLSLAGNRVGDSSIIELSRLIKSLGNLYTLNISCADITHRGIESLGQCLKSLLNSQSSLPLRELNISHNSLGPRCGPALSQLLLLCPDLTCLNLTDTGLHSYTLEPHTGLLEGLAGLSGLKTLNMSRNDIPCDGVVPVIRDSLKSLTSLDLGYSSPAPLSSVSLMSLSTECLVNLDLTGCNLSDVTPDFHEISFSFSLRVLCLRSTRLTPPTIISLSKYFQNCTMLHKLDVSGNPFLANDGLTGVLSYVPSLRELVSVDCGLNSPLPQHILVQFKKLKCLDLSDNRNIVETDRSILAGNWPQDRVVSNGNIFILK